MEITLKSGKANVPIDNNEATTCPLHRLIKYFEPNGQSHRLLPD